MFGFSVLLNRELLTDRTKYSNCCGMLNGGWYSIPSLRCVRSIFHLFRWGDFRSAVIFGRKPPTTSCTWYTLTPPGIPPPRVAMRNSSSTLSSCSSSPRLLTSIILGPGLYQYFFLILKISCVLTNLFLKKIVKSWKYVI